MAAKKKVIKSDLIVVSGKRKTALARAVLRKGNGSITINSKPLEILSKIHNLSLMEPIKIAQKVKPDIMSNTDINITVKGGGAESQIEASRLVIARALVTFSNNKELRESLTSYDRHLLIADVRRKETRKPGDSRARAKRQKSYR